MSRRDYYGYHRGRRGSKVFWVFFGIVAFAAIYFPFFGGNLRYQIGSFVSGIFEQIGTFLFYGGLILLGIGFIRMFTGGLKDIKLALLGVLLLWVALNFFNPGLWGIVTHGKEVPQGYH